VEPFKVFDQFDLAFKGGGLVRRGDAIDLEAFSLSIAIVVSQPGACHMAASSVTQAQAPPSQAG
jgi:hypothetical protein